MSLSEDEEFELLSLERERAGAAQQQPDASLQEQIPNIAQQAGQAALASSPANLTQKFMQTDPATMQRVGGGALPIAGGLAGGPIGAALGELARQATGTALAPDTVPETPLGRAASVVSAGVMQEPKILKAIPGVPKVVEIAGKLASGAGKGAARVLEAASGIPAQDIKWLARNPAALFKRGSRGAAGEAIGAAKRLAGVNPGVTEEVATFTPKNLSKALDVDGTGATAAMSVAEKYASGQKPSVEEVGDALKFIGKKIKVGMRAGEDVSELTNTQTHLNSILEEIAPNVQKARQEFAPLAQRDKFLKIFPTNKNGTISKANLFYLNAIAKGATIPFRAPIVAGLATSALGGLNKLSQNPAARQVLLQVLQKLQQRNPPTQAVP